MDLKKWEIKAGNSDGSEIVHIFEHPKEPTIELAAMEICKEISGKNPLLETLPREGNISINKLKKRGYTISSIKELK